MKINIGGARILIVPLELSHATSIYRAHGLLEQLRLAGFDAEIVSFQKAYNQCKDNVVIFQRIGIPEHGYAMVEYIRENARQLLYDIDDYLLNVADIPATTERTNQVKTARFLIETAHAAIASTARLKELLEQEMDATVHLRRNVLMQRNVGVPLDASIPQPQWVIGYACGSRTHDADFTVAIDGIARLMQEFQQVTFAYIGDKNLQLPKQFSHSFAGRVKAYPYVPYDGLFDLLRRKFTVTIAPLVDTKFNSCKSNVKVLESGLVGVPIICSPVGMYAQTLVDGTNGFLAETPEEWYRHLKALLFSSHLRSEIAKNIRRDVISQYTTSCLDDVNEIFTNQVVFGPPAVPSAPVAASSIPVVKKRLAIATYRWHCAHQWELHHLPCDFALVQCDSSLPWDYRCRPLRDNAVIIPESKMDWTQTDLAILHFDECCISTRHTLGVLHKGWGEQFRLLLAHYSGPKVAICHGTVPRKGAFDLNFAGDPWEIDNDARQAIVDLLGDTLVICNSNQAKQDWGFRNCRVVYHGFAVHEYPLGTRDRDIYLGCSALLSKPWYQGLPFVKKAIAAGVSFDYLGNVGNLALNPVQVPEPLDTRVQNNRYAFLRYNAYKQFLGRYRIYFNPTMFSPMPRMRAEAMLVGSCIVTTGFQDESTWLENEKTGFVSNDPEQLVDYLKFLKDRPEVTSKVGQAGRTFAGQFFSRSKFLKVWTEIITELLESKQP